MHKINSDFCIFINVNFNDVTVKKKKILNSSMFLKCTGKSIILSANSQIQKPV